MSTYNDLLNSTLTAIQNLNLSGISMGQINIRLLPKVQETLDVLPQVCICPSDTPEIMVRAGFESCVYMTYTIQIVIISEGNMVLTNQNLPQYLTWRQTIWKYFQQTPLMNFTSGSGYLWNCIPTFDSPINRDLVSQLYDYQSLEIKFFVSEAE